MSTISLYFRDDEASKHTLTSLITSNENLLIYLRVNINLDGCHAFRITLLVIRGIDCKHSTRTACMNRSMFIFVATQ